MTPVILCNGLKKVSYNIDQDDSMACVLLSK